jgi:hypothetical protein
VTDDTANPMTKPSTTMMTPSTTYATALEPVDANTRPGAPGTDAGTGGAQWTIGSGRASGAAQSTGG